jgi:hypothetical protein
LTDGLRIDAHPSDKRGGDVALRVPFVCVRRIVRWIIEIRARAATFGRRQEVSQPVLRGSNPSLPPCSNPRLNWLRGAIPYSDSHRDEDPQLLSARVRHRRVRSRQSGLRPRGAAESVAQQEHLVKTHAAPRGNHRSDGGDLHAPRLDSPVRSDDSESSSRIPC